MSRVVIRNTCKKMNYCNIGWHAANEKPFKARKYFQFPLKTYCKYDGGKHQSCISLRHFFEESVRNSVNLSESVNFLKCLSSDKPNMCSRLIQFKKNSFI